MSDPVLDLSPPAGPPLPSEPQEDGADDREGFLANLAFLVRFAFGRY